MPNILKLITAESRRETMTAEVVSRGHSDTYTVKIGSREMVVRSAVNTVLQRGQRVIINKSAGQMYIVGRETPGDRQTKTVTIIG